MKPPFVLVRLGKWGLVSKDPALALVLYVPDYHQLTSAVKARFLLLHSSLSFFRSPALRFLLCWQFCTLDGPNVLHHSGHDWLSSKEILHTDQNFAIPLSMHPKELQ